MLTSKALKANYEKEKNKENRKTKKDDAAKIKDIKTKESETHRLKKVSISPKKYQKKFQTKNKKERTS